MAFEERGRHTQRERERRMMTWHNLIRLLAQCKSKTNLPWQVQLSWQDPTGISNSLTSQIKPTACRTHPPRVRGKIIPKNKNLWWFECLSKSWLWLRFNGRRFSWKVLHLARSPRPRGGYKKNTHAHLKEDNEKRWNSLYERNIKKSLSIRLRTGTVRWCLAHCWVTTADSQLYIRPQTLKPQQHIYRGDCGRGFYTMTLTAYCFSCIIKRPIEKSCRTRGGGVLKPCCNPGTVLLILPP